MFPRTDSPRRRRRGGYTLIELLVVVVFIAILATIALNRFQDVSRKSLDTTIKSDIRNAVAAEVRYYTDAGAYIPFSVTSGGKATELDFDASPGVSITATLAGAGIKIVGSHPGSTQSWCLNTSSSSEIVSGTSC